MKEEAFDPLESVRKAQVLLREDAGNPSITTALAAVATSLCGIDEKLAVAVDMLATIEAKSEAIAETVAESFGKILVSLATNSYARRGDDA